MRPCSAALFEEFGTVKKRKGAKRQEKDKFGKTTKLVAVIDKISRSE
jgi:hypothetical protein